MRCFRRGDLERSDADGTPRWSRVVYPSQKLLPGMELEIKRGSKEDPTLGLIGLCLESGLDEKISWFPISKECVMLKTNFLFLFLFQ